MREMFDFFSRSCIISSNKRLEKLLVREALSQIGNRGGGCLSTIWGQIAAGSAWAQCLLDRLREKLVDTMEQSERLARREINGRGAHGRRLRRIYPNRILCIKLVLLFYTGPDWWCVVLSSGKESRLYPSDPAEDQAHYRFVFL